MQKTILLTGATDGIGFETAKMLVSLGHNVLLHGRNPSKLAHVNETLNSLETSGTTETYLADLSDIAEVEALAQNVTEKHTKLDVLINNAGILKTANPITKDGLDVRFVVNAIAPFVLTKRLLPLMDKTGRVVNLSSAAQRPVEPKALLGEIALDDMNAYAQSKLAITMWSRQLAKEVGQDGPMIVAVNPGSLLASKMVKEGFGVQGSDLRIGADILKRAALDDEFTAASGKYFDNDSRQFASPHPDALDAEKSQMIVDLIESVLAKL